MTREELENEEDFNMEETIGGGDVDINDDAFDLDFGDEEVPVEHEEETPVSTDPNVPATEEVEEEVEEEKEIEKEVENKDGEEELEVEEEGDEELFTPFVNHLVEKGVLNVNPDKEYEDSEEGFAEIVKDTVEAKLRETREKLSPEIQKLIEIGEKGGNIREAFEEAYSFDYREIDMSVEDNKVELVKEHLLSQGYEETDLEKMVEGLKDLNMLDRNAEVAQKFFVNKQEAEREAYSAKLEAKQAEATKAQEETMREVMHKIDTVESLGAFKDIPKQDREAFKKYLFEKDETGQTQAQKDNNLDAILINEFNKFKKFNYDGIERRAKTKTTIDWRKKAQRVTDKIQEAKGSGQKRYTRPDDEGAFALGEIDI